MIPDLNQEPLTQQPQSLILGLEPRNESQPLIDSPRRASDRKDPTRLVAEALESELVRRNNPCHNSGPGDFFDCNACLSAATDPVVTCCGHLFCWPCFYFLPYETASNDVKECPVCAGDVTLSDLVPIYGAADDKSHPPGGIKRKSTPGGSEVPPRPAAKRLEAKTEQVQLRMARIQRRIRELEVAGQRAGRTGNEYESEYFLNALQFSRLVLHGNASLGLEEDRIWDWSPPHYHYMFDPVTRRT